MVQKRLIVGQQLKTIKDNFKNGELGEKDKRRIGRIWQIYKKSVLKSCTCGFFFCTVGTPLPIHRMGGFPPKIQSHPAVRMQILRNFFQKGFALTVLAA